MEVPVQCGRVQRRPSVVVGGVDVNVGSVQELAHQSEVPLGPNSIEKIWLEYWLEKSLEFLLEIPIH